MAPRLPHVLDEALFRSVLIRERKRADRSERPLALVRVNVDADPDTKMSTPHPVIEALAAARRQTDTVGWLAWPAVVALLAPDTAVERLRARVRGELARRLPADEVLRIPLRVHVYPEPKHRGGWPVDTLLYPDVHARRGKGRYEATKRRLDVAGSVALLLALAPLFALIAMLVKATSRGPVLFRQQRVGQMMRPFTMLKFRTMYPAADPTVHHAFVSSFIKANGHGGPAGQNGVFKLTNDPRVTPLGRILRKTSLDELPQLWNVLRGDMSLVGPRPSIPYELEDYKPWHRRRVLEAKPGITGLWQVMGRSRTSFDDMVRLDLRYARTRSLWTDIRILLATPAAVIAGKGAC